MFLAILGLLPAIPHMVAGIEKLFGHNNGPAKKQAALAAIGDMVNIFGQANGNGATSADSSTMTYIEDLIEATVKLFNSNGTFTHGAK